MKRHPIIAFIYLGLVLVIGYFISAQISHFLGISTYLEIPLELPQ